MTPQKLRVGFDLDGVILYNPARAVRRPFSVVKRLIAPKELGHFYFPKNPHFQAINKLFHKSSFMVAPGFAEIIDLAKKGYIEAYIITARWSFLKDDFEWWMKKLHVPVHFKSYHMNEDNEQPHQFKERLVKDLHLDIFVEDNLDIVQHLEKSTDAQILWIYNIFDHFVKREKRYPSLAKAVAYIGNYAKKRPS
jgi:hypothetical protein